MSTRVLTDGLEDHAALLAVRRVNPAAGVPDGIEILSHKAGRGVYRLPGVGPGGSSLIAKRCVPPKSLVEHHMYTHVLPHVGLEYARLHAFLEEGPDGGSWLVIEDVGRTRYDPADLEHRVDGARWLAAFHVAASDMKDRALPDKGASSYEPDLIALSTRLASRDLDHSDSRLGRLLQRAARLCESAEREWNAVLDTCRSAPQTVVHGDCLAKNVHVRYTPEGPVTIPVDWGSAGWGPAATCIGQLDLPRYPQLTGAAQHGAYLEVVSRKWPHLDREHIGRLAASGRLFWAVKAVGWGLDAIEWKSEKWALVDLDLYVQALDDAVRSIRHAHVN